MQLMMLDETMNGPQAVRYDEVYYPRTDKRAIRKSLRRPRPHATRWPLP